MQLSHSGLSHSGLNCMLSNEMCRLDLRYFDHNFPVEMCDEKKLIKNHFFASSCHTQTHSQRRLKILKESCLSEWMKILAIQTTRAAAAA